MNVTTGRRPVVLVTGGTGTLGTQVVRRLEHSGAEIRVLSRKQRPARDGLEYFVGDLESGGGVEAAVRGAGVIVHCASAPKGDAKATRRLVEIARRIDPLPHLAFISVVGVAGVRFGYFQEKLAAERVVTESGLPWTLQRATQFFDYLLNGSRSLARLPVIPVPKDFRVQPIDPGEVAGRLAELALQPPAGRVADIGGPEVSTWAELTREYVQAIGARRHVVELWMPFTKEIRAGALLANGGSTPYGKTSWRDFLARKFG